MIGKHSTSEKNIDSNLQSEKTVTLHSLRSTNIGKLVRKLDYNGQDNISPIANLH
jgi:hypothetical protein